MAQDVRWRQRFEHFERAVELLREPVETGIENLSELERKGTVHALIRGVLARHPGVAWLFGSRAKGTARPASDIDLALEGPEDPLVTAAVEGELDELPLPYRFDVVSVATIRSQALLDPIARVGVRIDG